MRFKNLRAKKGQNTAEYLIMLVLIAVGSIGFVSAFGKTIKRQFKNSMVAIEGEGALDTDAASDDETVGASSMKVEN